MYPIVFILFKNIYTYVAKEHTFQLLLCLVKIVEFYVCLCAVIKKMIKNLTQRIQLLYTNTPIQ